MEKSYIDAVTKKLRKQGLSEEEVKVELNKIMDTEEETSSEEEELVDTDEEEEELVDTDEEVA